MLPFMFFLVMAGNDVVKLPRPEFTGVSIEKCIETRRSVRAYKDKELSLQQISNILWAAQGITEKRNELRAIPSAGATYPLEVFVAKKDGFYRYIPQSHSLKRELQKDIRRDISQAALGQGFVSDAGLVVVITAIFERTALRYGDRAVRYVYMEAGHCAQNIHLEAVALGLGSVPVGAFNDSKLSAVLKLKDEEPLYIVPVGYTK